LKNETLENEDGETSVVDHFERAVFINEIMTASIIKD